MNRYTIYCTESQTKKALELGAPITFARVIDTIEGKSIRIPENYGDFYLTPTAEQIIGWIEEQEEIFKVEITTAYDEYGEGWCYCIFDKDMCNVGFNRDYPSRPEATLAAIDAALEYLSNNKK